MKQIKFADRDQRAIQERLQSLMYEEGLDGLLLTDVCAIYYATGHLSAFQMGANVPGYCIGVLPAEGEFSVILPDYEVLADYEQAPGVKLEIATTGIYVDEIELLTGKPAPRERPNTVDGSISFKMALSILMAKKANPKIGIQKRLLTVDAMKILEENGAGCTFADCEHLLDVARMIKTPWEIDVLRNAAQYSELAMNATAAETKVGMSYGEVMMNYSRNCFSFKEASGLHAAMCIGRNYCAYVIAPEMYVKRGDILRLDCGPHYFGYISDICRNYSIGPASDEAKRLYSVLIKAYERELELIGPGVRIADVFREVQEIVRQNGYPDYLRGHLGHSIGTYHLGEEYPYISPGAGDLTFQPGMVLSVEIPYNNPRIGGLTPEDSLVITENGYELFTNVPREIVEMPEDGGDRNE